MLEQIDAHAGISLDHSKQDVLGVNVFVIEALGLLIGQRHDLPGSISEALKQRDAPRKASLLFLLERKPIEIGGRVGKIDISIAIRVEQVHASYGIHRGPGVRQHTQTAQATQEGEGIAHRPEVGTMKGPARVPAARRITQRISTKARITLGRDPAFHNVETGATYAALGMARRPAGVARARIGRDAFARIVTLARGIALGTATWAARVAFAWIVIGVDVRLRIAKAWVASTGIKAFAKRVAAPIGAGRAAWVAQARITRTEVIRFAQDAARVASTGVVVLAGGIAFRAAGRPAWIAQAWFALAGVKPRAKRIARTGRARARVEGLAQGIAFRAALWSARIGQTWRTAIDVKRMAKRVAFGLAARRAGVADAKVKAGTHAWIELGAGRIAGAGRARAGVEPRTRGIAGARSAGTNVEFRAGRVAVTGKALAKIEPKTQRVALRMAVRPAWVANAWIDAGALARIEGRIAKRVTLRRDGRLAPGVARGHRVADYVAVVPIDTVARIKPRADRVALRRNRRPAPGVAPG